MLVLGAADWAGAQLPRSRSTSLPDVERTTLGAAFVGGQARGLEPLLHPDFVVQPPQPDTALKGPPAIRYLTRLAIHTSVSQSRLDPQAVVPEGVFLLEQGTWMLRVGDRVLRSRYHLRWRRSNGGWRVVLWGWSVFRERGAGIR